MRSLYLVSSSASREYVIDCLEALALPRGALHHFRYRNKYVEPALARRLPTSPGRLSRSLQGSPIVVLFMTSSRGPDDEYRPRENYVPLRCGELVDAFRDGEICHFFFSVAGYPKHRKGGSSLVNDRVRFGGNYAVLGPTVVPSTKQAADSVGFQGFIDFAFEPSQWRTLATGRVPLDLSYEVIFYRVEGLYRERRLKNGIELRLLKPELVLVPGSPYARYDLSSGETYRLRISTYLRTQTGPADIPGQGRAVLSLRCDKSVFATPEPTELRVASSYDLEQWCIIPRVPSLHGTHLQVICAGGDRRADDANDFTRREVACAHVTLRVRIVE